MVRHRLYHPIVYVLSFRSLPAVIAASKDNVECAKHYASKLHANDSLDALVVRCDGGIGDNGTQVISEALRHHKHLMKLDLKFNRIHDGGAVALARAICKRPHNSSPLRLLLSGNNIGPSGAKAFAGALANKSCSSLSHLDLWDNNVTTDGGIELARALGHSESLSVLQLGQNGIGQEAGQFFGESLNKNSALRELYLGHNGLNGQGIISFEGNLIRNDALKILEFNGNNIDDCGAHALSKIVQKNGGLFTLWLRDNNISDKGAAYIFDGIRKGLEFCQGSAIKELDLSGNSIGDIGAEAFARLLLNNTNSTNLSIVALEENLISKEGARVIAENMIQRAVRNLSYCEVRVSDCSAMSAFFLKYIQSRSMNNAQTAVFSGSCPLFLFTLLSIISGIAVMS